VSRNERLLRLLLCVSHRADDAWARWASSCTDERRAVLDHYNARYKRIYAAAMTAMSGVPGSEAGLRFGNSRDLTAKTVKLIEGVLCDVAQLLEGWHADGTAWSEWDESVRQRVTALQKFLEEVKA
jgi:hypothetical protein